MANTLTYLRRRSRTTSARLAAAVRPLESLEPRTLLDWHPYPDWSVTNMPGTIQAENFDSDGEGRGYHDLTAGNTGGQYRPAGGVDIEKSSDTGGGYDVGWNQPGEWLQYTVNVPGGSVYDIDIRAAYGGPNPTGGTAHLETFGVEDGRVSVPFTLPKTGGWQKWQTVSLKNVALPSGTYDLNLVMDKDGAGSTAPNAYLANINWIKITRPAVPFPGPNPVALPARIPAANFDNGSDGAAYHDLTPANLGGQYRPAQGVDIEKSSEGGYDVGWNQPGEWLAYSVDSGANPFNLNLNIRTAYGGPNATGGTVSLWIDGYEMVSGISLPNTGGWQKWQTVTTPAVTLLSGKHILKLHMDQDGADNSTNGYLGNIAWFELAQPNTPTGHLSDPQNGDFVIGSALNGRKYIDITYSAAAALNTTSITDAGSEFYLYSSFAEESSGVVINGSPTWLGGSTYRYSFTGAFAEPASVSVEFIPGSFADVNGATNLRQTAPWFDVLWYPPAIGEVGDLGQVGVHGHTFVNGDGTYTMQASGADIWGNADAGQFGSYFMSGDCQFIAHVQSLDNTDPWAKAGVMFRDGDESVANAANVYLAVSPTSGTVFQYRQTAGGSTVGVLGPKVAAPTWLKLVRQGDTFSGYQSSNGTTWTFVGSKTVALPRTLHVGLAGTSHNNAKLTTAVFDNLRLEPVS